jgi:prolipoprotein diacylglyceryltransferase
MDAVNATQIANPKDAYTAIATDPKFASLLEQVPLNIPPSYMKRLLHFCFAILFFVLKTEKENTLAIFGMFLVLFSVRIVVESVKESQGGFESTLGLLSTGQWLSIPLYSLDFILYLLQKEQSSL